jgi:hypothetical protein
MAFSPVSFLLGIGTAYVLPIISRNFRPLAVEAAAMGLGLLEDLRRVLAEQMENLEDIAAEARARRDELASRVEPEGGSEANETDDEVEEASAPAHDVGRARRRARRSRSRAE